MFQKRLFYFFYNQKKRKIKRELSNLSYEDAEKILMLAKVVHQDQLDELYQLITKLTYDAKKFHIFVWTEEKTVLQLPILKNISYISSKDFTFYDVPKKSAPFLKILHENFDLYMDLLTDRDLHFMWLAEFNLARFKTGFDRFDRHVFDVNVSIPTNEQFSLIENFNIFVRYLSWFGKKNEKHEK